jgi:hypothetical protein|tara:strand:+ start:1086 stop:1697 length:612 start_codon:yes stop_codon:yes gene_type:complete
MSDSKFDICSKALVLVGANTITSFSESTTESKVANQLYESTLENLLTRTRWRFAAKQAQLSRNASAPTARWSAKYAVPSGTLLIHTVTVNDNVIEFDRYESDILCDASSSDTVVADYTFQPSEANFPPYFKQALVFELASLFAGAIARNDTLSTLYQNRAIAQMAIARAQDSQAQTTRKVDTTRFRNRRNSGSLGTIKATVSS